MPLQKKRISPRRSHPVLLRGGLRVDKSSLETKDGFCRQLDNYEINLEGEYQSITGFERFSGRPAPSEAQHIGSFTNDEDETENRLLQRENRRVLIQAVPGSGPVLGVFNIGATVYAIRDNATKTEAMLYQSSVNGWQAVPTGVTLLPGGNYQFTTMNWANRSGLEVVAVDGKNPAFVFDGTTFTQIVNPGMAGKDAPTAVAVLPADIIMLAYPGGSLQYTNVGSLEFTGGGEMAVADEIVSLQNEPGDVMAIIGQNSIELLYGRTSASWQKRVLESKTGATAKTIQQASGSIYINEHALTTLSRTEKFGDYEVKGLSSNVSSIIKNYRSRATASIFIRDKSQYRVFFDDGTALTCTLLEGQPLGFSTLTLGQVFTCAHSGEDDKFNEVIYAGSDNGFVYQLERGTSLDGREIETMVTPQFSHCRSYDQNKSFKRFTVEGQTLSPIHFFVVPYFEYLTPDLPESPPGEFTAIGGGGVFDQARFDEFYWNSAVLYQGDVPIVGRGTNVSVFLRTSSLSATPHLVKSITYYFTTQGQRK